VTIEAICHAAQREANELPDLIEEIVRRGQQRGEATPDDVRAQYLEIALHGSIDC